MLFPVVNMPCLAVKPSLIWTVILRLRTLFQTIKYAISFPCLLHFPFFFTLFLETVTPFLLPFSLYHFPSLCCCVPFLIHPLPYPASSSPVQLACRVSTLSHISSRGLTRARTAVCHFSPYPSCPLSLKMEATRCKL